VWEERTDSSVNGCAAFPGEVAAAGAGGRLRGPTLHFTHPIEDNHERSSRVLVSNK
jgi:hypothetical protein